MCSCAGGPDGHKISFYKAAIGDSAPGHTNSKLVWREERCGPRHDLPHDCPGCDTADDEATSDWTDPTIFFLHSEQGRGREERPDGGRHAAGGDGVAEAGEVDQRLLPPPWGGVAYGRLVEGDFVTIGATSCSATDSHHGVLDVVAAQPDLLDVRVPLRGYGGVRV